MKFTAALVGALVALPAAAQADRCIVPGMLPQPRPDGPTPSEPRRVVQTGGYTLALSWAPQHCRTSRDDPDDRFQCASGNRFGFVLHGLWPDGRGRAWPQYCAPAPLLDAALVRRHLCMTPSVQLLQHEYAKHGTCMRTTPARYFALASRLYERVRYPDMASLARRPGLTAGQFAAAFARANPGMTAAMMRITATRDGWLREVWLCRDLRFAAVRCPAHQRGVSASSPLKIRRAV